MVTQNTPSASLVKGPKPRESSPYTEGRRLLINDTSRSWRDEITDPSGTEQSHVAVQAEV